jgi:hypothetical protein
VAQNEQFERFIERLAARPLPQNALARVRALAKELAEGAAEGVWPVAMRQFRGALMEEAVVAYVQQRWGEAAPHIHLLLSNGYVQATATDYELTKAAFDLVEEREAANIFISYRRKDSSAFALLVLARLKAVGLEPFLDLALEPGEDWQAGLRERIRRYDYLIALLGPGTLASEVVVQELTWALESGLHILPVWHGGFRYQADDWPDVPAEVRAALGARHTIRVLEESALAYNNAIVELLNRFGVTP